MPSTPGTVRLVSAALAVAVTATLVMTKVQFNDQLTRLTAPHDAVVLPVVEVVAERSAHLAAVAQAQRAH
jgi:hypothetical protein